MKYNVEYHEGMSFCEMAKDFGISPYDILKQNNIHNILDLIDGQILTIEVKEGD